MFARYVLLALSGLALLLSFFGGLHGAGDTLAVLRPMLVPIVGVLSLAALLLRPRTVGLAGLGLTVLAGASLAPPGPVSSLPEGAARYSAYQKNLLFLLPDTGPVAADILASDADFVMLQELHARNRPILDQLRAEYPHQHYCFVANYGGTAVLSRWPTVEGRTLCGEGSDLAAMQVTTPEGPLWVASLHLHWPFPYRQPEHVERLLPVLETLDAPIVVGGDFNMVPWSYSVKAISAATKTKLSGFVGGTFKFSFHNEGRNLVGWLPRLPIDFVLIPEAGDAASLQRRERLGSDHHGLVATFTF